MEKRPFDIDEMFRRLRAATAGLPKAAMFELRDRGHDTPFEQLVGSLISARTRDGTTIEVCERLFDVARTPEAMAAMEAVLPRRYRIEINERLVPFGKAVCTGTGPRCATCPVPEFCRQVGVTSHR
jgi:endonuclease III